MVRWPDYNCNVTDIYFLHVATLSYWSSIQDLFNTTQSPIPSLPHPITCHLPVSRGAPVSLQNFPGLQSLQSDSDSAPRKSRYVPLGQSTMYVVPSGQYFPSWHWSPHVIMVWSVIKIKVTPCYFCKEKVHLRSCYCYQCNLKRSTKQSIIVFHIFFHLTYFLMSSNVYIMVTWFYNSYG